MSRLQYAVKLSILSVSIRYPHMTHPSCFNSNDLVEGFGGLPNIGVHGGRVSLVALLAVLPKFLAGFADSF